MLSGVSPWQLVTPSVPGRLVFPPPPSAPVENATLEYMDPTLPPLLPAHNPKCSLLVLQYNFADTVGAPPVTANYTPPPDCPAPWSRVVLELSASASGLQKDPLLPCGSTVRRSSEPQPHSLCPPASSGGCARTSPATRRSYAADPPYEGDQPRVLSMMLQNSNVKYPGVYTVNVSLHFYCGALCFGGCIGLKPAGESKRAELGPALSAHPTIKGIYREPADMIIPISNGDGSKGFWFHLENETEVQGTTVQLPNNTYRAVLEVYVWHHGDDEYWYANPFRTNGPEGLRPQQGGDNRLESSKANGGFCQVVATVGGRYVGSAILFPVIYPGSVNPFFWAPVAAIGAYDHPSYDFDLTPFVGKLIDGAPHVFGLAVRDSQPFSLVSANLHVCVDAWSDTVEEGLVRYKVPTFRLSRQAD